MARNVEIKVRLAEAALTRTRVAALADRGPVRLEQEDTFFHVARGRLKLRRLGPAEGQLIFYERPDRPDPTPSTYQVAPTDDPAALRALLDSALGRRATVRKVRELWHIGRTRVHLDRVEGLGDYLELEVVLAEEEAVEVGVAEARQLVSRLGLEGAEAISRAYVDLLAGTEE